MHSVRKFIHLLTLTLFALVLTACSDDDVVSGISSEHGVYVSMYIDRGLRAPATKAGTPTPGENGDGRYRAEEDESKVEDIYAFFYPAKDDDGNDITLNDGQHDDVELIPVYFDQWEKSEKLSETSRDGAYSNDNTTDNANKTYNNSDYDRYQKTQTQIVDGIVPTGQYRVIVVANAGQSALASVKTLGQLRACTVGQPWSEITEGESTTTYNRFLMSSESETSVTFTGLGTEGDPLIVNPVTIERLAARVDYKCANANNTFTFTDENNNTVSVEITGAMLFNVANAAHTSYLLKRVTSSAEPTKFDAPVYLGDETVDDNGLASNYVIDPNTSRKSEITQKADNYQPGIWSNSYDRLLQGTDWKTQLANTDFTKNFVAPNGTSWQPLGYAMENVAPATCADEYFDTGIIFKATYDNGVTEITFTYNGTSYTSSNITTMLTQMLTNTYGTPSFSSRNTLNNYINNYSGSDPMGYIAYLKYMYQNYVTSSRRYNSYSSYLTLSYYASTNSSSYGGSTYSLLTKLNIDKKGGYDDNWNYVYTYTINSDTYSLLQAMGFGNALTYHGPESGTCYYTYYIRHAADNDSDTDTDAKSMMEHAIVRNNIYQVTVASVSKIGSEVPFDKQGIDIVVAVKDWATLNEETIEF